MLYKLNLKHGTANANTVPYTGSQDNLQTVITTYLQFKINSIIACTITVSKGLEWDKSFDRNVIAKLGISQSFLILCRILNQRLL